MDEFFIDNTKLPQQILMLISKHARKLKLTSTSISSKNLIINTNQTFTNLNTTIETNDFKNLIEYKNCSCEVEVFDDNILVMGRVGNVQIEETISIGFELICMSENVNYEPLCSFKITDRLKNVFRVLNDFEEIKISVKKNFVSIDGSNSHVKFSSSFENYEMITFEEEFEIKLRIGDLSVLTYNFDRYVISFLREFLIIYLYQNESVAVLKIKY